MSIILGANTLTAGYDVDNSCRFNDGDSPQAKKDTTSSDNIVRDYITPPDFNNLMQLVIDLYLVY